MAIASLVLGIAALILGILVVGSLFGIVGIVLGVVGMSRARAAGGHGKGIAVAGTVLSGLGILFAIVVIIAGVAFFQSHRGAFTTYGQCLSNAQTHAEIQSCNREFHVNLQNP